MSPVIKPVTAPEIKEPNPELKRFADVYAEGLHKRGFATDLPRFQASGIAVTITVIATTGHELAVTLYYKPSAGSFSFSTRLAPEKTLRLEEQFFLSWAEFASALPKDNGVHIYSDGSYKDTLCSYAYIIFKEGEILHKDAAIVPAEDTLGSYQIAGELQAVLRSLEWCSKNNINSVTVHHDLRGVADWATGTYKTKAVISQLYRNRLNELPVSVTWQKEAAHTGVALNEYVDILAKRAIAQELARNPLPEMPADNPLSRTGKKFLYHCAALGLEFTEAGYYAGNSNLKYRVAQQGVECGFVNIYIKKGGRFSAAFHELKNSSVRATLQKEWESFALATGLM